MKKTLIASAVAAATLSTGAMAAGETEIYGSLEVVYSNTSSKEVLMDASGNPVMLNNAAVLRDASDNEAGDNGSTIGIKHSHQISEGLTGFAKAEFEFSTDEDASGIDNLDEAYIGVKGDFGSIQYGKDDNVYEWVDMIDTSEAVGLGGELANSAVNGNGQDESYEDENIQYVSPEIADGLTVGITIPAESDNTYGGTLAAKFATDNLEVAVAYAMGRQEAADYEAGDTIGIAASFSLDDLTLIVQHENRDETKSNGVGNSDRTEYYGLQAMYAMGANQFALGYQIVSQHGVQEYRTDFNDNSVRKEDETAIAVQALHNLSDNMYVYMEYVMTEDVDGEKGHDEDTFALGATYSF